jgi:hypothetical protein
VSSHGGCVRQQVNGTIPGGRRVAWVLEKTRCMSWYSSGNSTSGAWSGLSTVVVLTDTARHLPQHSCDQPSSLL